VEPKLCSPSELRTSGRPWGLLGEKYLNNLLEKQVSESSDIQMYIYICMDQNKLLLSYQWNMMGGANGRSHRNLGLTSQKMQHFLFKFSFPKPVHVEMKSLPAHLPFCICLLLVSPNYFEL